MDSKASFQKKTSSPKRKKLEEFIVDEILFKIGPKLIWLWIAIEPENRRILAQIITQERDMFVAERFMPRVVRDYGKHPYPQMVEHCIPWLVSFSNSITIFIPLTRKV
ncbi:DDE-type integrase/transposase/recombinase [Candidatus Nitrosocosmicus franklandus]|uniref:DDE domain-containing protein n=1 Tax=Candidatus Nitrosocosmicus franklandianus TaxID=1798806 RepID=A0A484IEY1_9ARCH|nr:DDE-type integrase/transposase/recombinase [Candidatus Nitrosocosmicus franklandus]VFJ14699.1 protein of unknown function [Candidatus Nitrosocosmicus franklandus]